ncbi:hypothetical protein Bpfe_019634 [Biomphalaria pfeifferi]|uniref:Uncharacterized protein n=1 Tax=Biomphalaria pfeifferi TaxID=112525 RepID=A0AAD8BAB7_BIOPF|nr:hypothetical protein Bpfe_019634 [Biomphalaria pfeifferi]
MPNALSSVACFSSMPHHLYHVQLNAPSSVSSFNSMPIICIMLRSMPHHLYHRLTLCPSSVSCFSSMPHHLYHRLTLCPIICSMFQLNAPSSVASFNSMPHHLYHRLTLCTLCTKQQPQFVGCPDPSFIIASCNLCLLATLTSKSLLPRATAKLKVFREK